MSFISYAQNFEDLTLYRALSNVEEGFYIDVGAHDPVVDSVSKAFYDRGWRGINIDPVKEWYDRLDKGRPKDINIQTAVGEKNGELDFYEVVGTGLSTICESIAQAHSKETECEIKTYSVPISTLTKICELHPNENIHFIKIDVEGAEQAVLKGLDLKKIRPWIIVLESTLPNTQIKCHQEWEPDLLANDYDFAYFDSLNRYYVAKEHAELKDKLALPPNVFDNFTVSGTGTNSIQQQVCQVLTPLKEVRETLQAIQNSTCWRITWPLRKLIGLFRSPKFKEN